MPTWNISFNHAGSSAKSSGTIQNYAGFGVGNSGTTPNVPCSCGRNHTFTGRQDSNSHASGSGAGSVAPPNDPPQDTPGAAQLDPPSWEAQITTPLSDKKPKKKAAKK